MKQKAGLQINETEEKYAYKRKQETIMQTNEIRKQVLK